MANGFALSELSQQPQTLERVRGFQPKMFIKFETDDFIVKTAEHQSEFMRVLELRHEVFIREWQGRELPSGLDLEPYDFVGDHILIINKKLDMVVGTYRVLCSEFCDRFYSQDEFYMGAFLMRPGTKLELGRACIHADFRDGNTIDLLWKGLARYIEATRSQYLFGCTSIKTVNQQKIESLIGDLQAGENWSDEFCIRATSHYQFKGLNFLAPQIEEGFRARDWVPPLLRSYLHAGAKVYGEPALDRQFACVDMLTVLDMRNLTKRFQARYFLK